MLDNKTINLVMEASILASRSIMQVYNTGFSPNFKIDGSPVTAADLKSSEILLNALAQTQIPVISEEDLDEPYSVRKNWTINWCVDPLDGTKEFIKKNNEFCISIALIENGLPTFGCICSPTEETILFGGKDYGVFLTSFDDFKSNKSPEKLIAKSTVNNPMVICRSHAPMGKKSLSFIKDIQSKFENITILKKGSALKFLDLAKGKADVYTRFAPTMEWDIAGGHAILKGLGGEIISAETNLPLTYNKESLFNPHFVAMTSAYIKTVSL